MHILNRFLVVAAIFSFAVATDGNAAEGPTSRVSATPLQSRNVAKARTELVGFSETADLACWLSYEHYPFSPTPNILRVDYVNLGSHSSYRRVIFLLITPANGEDSLFEFDLTEVLAPKQSGSRTFVIPSEFMDVGFVASVGIYGTDDDPSNDYDQIKIR